MKITNFKAKVLYYPIITLFLLSLASTIVSCGPLKPKYTDLRKIPGNDAMMKNAKEIGPIRYGEIAPRSQYALIMLATAFTWMMGLMGYIRSSVRLFWHVNEIMRDNSPWAYTHTIGFAANVISFNVLFFCSCFV